MNSNVTVNLEAVWAATAAYAWAGGDSGTLVLNDGTKWQVRPSGSFSSSRRSMARRRPTSSRSRGITILHYDGATWSIRTSPLTQTVSLFAIGPKDVLLFGTSAAGLALVRLKEVGGNWETTMVKEGGFRQANFSTRMWAESLTSVYLPGGNYWDGATVKQLGEPTYGTRGPGRLWKSGALVLGLDWQNGITPMYQYRATDNTWVPMPTGFAGTIDDFQGSGDKRVFAVGSINQPGGGERSRPPVRRARLDEPANPAGREASRRVGPRVGRDLRRRWERSDPEGAVAARLIRGAGPSWTSTQKSRWEGNP